MENNYYTSSRYEMLTYVPINCKTILEIGCGEGNFSKLCKDKTGAYTIGIEYNQDVGEIARTKIDHVLIGDANEEIKNLANKSIDLVIFNDVLEHITYPDVLLNELRPKMNDKGLLLASIPNFRYISNLKHILWDKDFKYDKAGGIRDYTHMRFFTKKSIENFLIENNLEILEINGINRSINPILTFLIPLIKVSNNYDILFLQFAIMAKFI